MIVIVFGLPGSGKSYFASQLAGEIAASYVSSDIERNKLLEEKHYTREEKLFVYDQLLSIMKDHTSENKNLVLDATFYTENIRNKFLEAAGGIPVVFIEVFANEKISAERLSRKREFSDAGIEVYKKIKAAWEPLHDDHLKLESTNDNIGEMLEKAVRHIKHYNNDN